jgi:aryl-alcohol dehydrogenase (NADP+)
MDAAWAAGITAFDTADAYGGGRSERAIGRWLARKGPSVRDRLVLSTKTFNPMGTGEDFGLAPARVRRQLESSLLRLGVDYVDLYLIHEWDDGVPIAETLGVLDELVHAGLVRAVGASNVDGRQLASALRASEDAGLARFEWVQNEYSLLAREPEPEVLPLCLEHGLGFTPYSPLGGGWLTGKYRRTEPPAAGSRMILRPGPYLHLETDETYDALERFGVRASGRGVEPATLAFAWVLSHPQVTAAMAGPRSPRQLEPALAALELELSASERADLAELFGSVPTAAS